MVDNRVTFGSKLGVILATVGCAVGLGSIWRFPYMLGTNGGAAFLLIYILFMIFLGIPVMVTEFFIGRYSRSNTVGSFKKMAPGTKWCWIGYNGILAAFLILGFYAVVSGWTLEYVWQTVNGSLYSTPGVDFTAGFDNFSSNALRPIFWTAVFIGLTHFVIASGVEKGIERASKIMMPLLFFILVVMCVRSVTLPNAEAGLVYLFKPDFSKLTSSVVLSAVGQAFRIADGIGYIKLGQFARTTFDEMQASLDTLRAQGVTKLIFDLRGNSGGYLDQAIMVANEFLHKDQLIVYTEDRQHKQLREYADGTGAAQDMDVVVLIDEGSASSSEILAGALQDNDRGTIVGRRSFGKGLVQRQIPYSDGSALRLTTARYYTPTGRSIQKPYTIGDDESYEEDIWNRYKNNEFFSADSIHFADSLKRVTPGGKVVYGGGGIMPDVFVPADTTDVTKYFVEVAGRNILYRYTIEYADRHREALNKVRTIPELQALLDSDKGLVEDFIRYAARKGVAPDYRDIARSRKLIEAQLRAYIGRNTALEDNGFYANIYPVDNVVVRAIGILNDTQKND